MVHTYLAKTGQSRRRRGTLKCNGCPASRQTSRINITVAWPGGGVRLVELDLCGACTFALLDLVDSGAMKVGVQSSLPLGD
jgi:hypothetical protein